ncbi:MAG: glycosyltransferase family 4 protein [Solirubrobacterales bacterium]
MLASGSSAALADQRVLVVHNRYRQSGGEERYVRELMDLLGGHAAAAALYEHSSESIGRLSAGGAIIRGGREPERIGVAAGKIDATIVHAHNIHPAVGWRGLKAAHDSGAAVVMHLHNYRLFCAIGVAYRDGHDCLECAPRSTQQGLRHNCRGSMPEAAAYAIGLRRAQPHLAELVDLFVSPTKQLAADLHDAGLDLPIEVLPTSLPAAEIVDQSRCADGGYGLFAGRVTREKGILTAVEAAAKSGCALRVAGDGPALAEAVELAQTLSAPVDFLGHVDGQALVAARLGAAYCVIPSLWREVLPFAALEAMGGGIPLLVSRRGGLPELTDPELVFDAGDSDALAEQMRVLQGDQEIRAAAGERALRRAREHHGEQQFADRLATIYATATSCRAA